MGNDLTEGAMEGEKIDYLNCLLWLPDFQYRHDATCLTSAKQFELQNPVAKCVRKLLFICVCQHRIEPTNEVSCITT